MSIENLKCGVCGDRVIMKDVKGTEFLHWSETAADEVNVELKESFDVMTCEGCLTQFFTENDIAALDSLLDDEVSNNGL
jgi:hypothetical protein